MYETRKSKKWTSSGTKIDPKMNQKWTKNCLKMDQKITENRRKMTENGLNMDK